jgi:hypothetical protein
MIAFQTDPSMFRDSLVFTVFHPSNRITQAATSNSSWIQQFGYDATGNGWFATNTSLPALTQETPLAQSWFTAANRINGWTYDETGNILQIGTTPSLSRIFTYDAENRQITATINGGRPFGEEHFLAAMEERFQRKWRRMSHGEREIAKTA